MWDTLPITLEGPEKGFSRSLLRPLQKPETRCLSRKSLWKPDRVPKQNQKSDHPEQQWHIRRIRTATQTDCPKRDSHRRRKQLPRGSSTG